MKTQKIRKVTALAIGTILSFGLIFGGCSGKEDSSKDSQAGSDVETDVESDAELAKFVAKTLSGDSYTQDDLAEVDVTLFNFWATYCAPCIREMPEVAEFVKKLPDNVRIVTVCLDGQGNEEKAEEILAEAGFEGTTLIAGVTFEEDAGDFKTLCRNIMYTPTTLVIDADGNIVGDAIIGVQKDLEKTYTEAINGCLTLLGKEEIEIEE
ncbi:MAG: TlpA family protein disulfide reductase [Lachnospiraceae bacterium]|nr:TlpA family protein disulfide reductase [Lachnospiraceae bacterium]